MDLTPAADGGDAFVNESKLPGGTGAGSGGTSASGSFRVSAPDGIFVLRLRHDDTDYDIIVNNVFDEDDPPVITTALGNTLAITGYNETTGEVSYTYTLNDAEDHDDDPDTARNNLFEDFAVLLRDMDGDTTTGTLSIRIVDDIPVITHVSDPDLLLEVDESALGIVQSADFSGLFDIVHGADGEADANATAYALEIPSDGTESGLFDTATGAQILLSMDGGAVVGLVDGTGELAFTVSIDAETGEVTLEQQRAVRHPTPGASHDEAVRIANGAITLQVTAVDADGDSVTEMVAIGNRFSFRDDGPNVEVRSNDTFSGDLTTSDANTIGTATDSATLDFSGAFTVTSSYGADGEASSDALVRSYALSLKEGAGSVASGLSSGGQEITLYLIGGEVVGSTATAAGAVTDTNTVFTIGVDAGGWVTLSQIQPIDHPDGDDPGETLALAGDLIRLTGSATVTDGDGDTASHSHTIEIGDRFVFTDDGPVAGAVAPVSLDEADLGTLAASVTQTITDLSLGSDRMGGDTGVTFDAAQTGLAALNLASGGEDLDYVISGDGHVLTAYRGAGRDESDEVFTVTLTQPGAGNGWEASYTFTLKAPLDHPGTGTDLLDLPFAYTATDADGDTAGGSFTVQVQDDVPEAGVTDRGTISENGLGGPDEARIEGDITLLLGRDELGGTAGLAFAADQIADLEALGLTSGGVALGYAIVGDTLTASAGGAEVFTITLTPPSAGNGWQASYAFTLKAPLDHTTADPLDPGGRAPLDLPFSYTVTDADGDTADGGFQVRVEDSRPVAVVHPSQTGPEGGGTLSGNVIGSDAASADSVPTIHSFTYMDRANPAPPWPTHVFAEGETSVTVETPAGSLTVWTNGDWTFEPLDSFDHDEGVPATGTFHFRLVDADGSLSAATGSQPITINDTTPTAGDVTIALDESKIAGGSGAGTGVAVLTQALAITRSRDDIADVIFTEGTITGLTGQTLTSGGEALEYVITGDGHTLTAYLGDGRAEGDKVFTLEINNPGDAAGTSQSITATLLRPLDHAGGGGANTLAISVGYQVWDIDSVRNATLTINVADDVPLAPLNDTPVTVVEGGAAVGSANGGANLLANDVLGADGGRVHSITYTNRSGLLVEDVTVPAGGLINIQTQYGTLTVHQNGTWSYTAVTSANHVKPDTDTELSDNFTYRTIDSDGDVSPGSATQEITVTDTVPTIGTPVNGEVDEAKLPTGSEPGATVATRQTSGTLAVTGGRDTFRARLTLDDLPAGLTSGGQPVKFSLTNTDTTLYAYIGPDVALGAAPAMANRVFTVALANPTTNAARYTFTLQKALDHNGEAEMDLAFRFTVTDSDGDVATSGFTVKVIDDVPETSIEHTIDEDSSIRFNTSADANPGNTTIWFETDPVGAPGVFTELDPIAGEPGSYKTPHGTVTVHADGTITYEPDDDFSGEEVFQYRTEDGTISTTTVTMTVTPVADAPDLEVTDANINTQEDVPVALGFKAPVIVDDGTGDGNNPVSERLGMIALWGFPEGAKLLDGNGDELSAFGSGATSVTIVLTDYVIAGKHHAGVNGLMFMTSAEFEALQVLPPEHDATNFTINARVFSYEVDAGGTVLTDSDGDPIPGASTTTSVRVHVQAVTDDVALTFNGVTTGVTNVDDVTYGGTGGNTHANVWIKEDTGFNLRDILAASFADTDGSEVRSITIANTTGHTIMVNGVALDHGDSRDIPALTGAAGQTGTIASFPNIQIGGVGDFSGDLNGITVTINAQDYDADGYWEGGVLVIGPGGAAVPGIPEDDAVNNPGASILNNSVTLNLHVTPVAGDVAAGDVTTAEDTAVAFLASVRVTDTGTGDERITKVAFTIPTGWEVTAPTTGTLTGWTAPATGAGGTLYEITFDTTLTQAQREAVLDGFTIKPPAHSSVDVPVLNLLVTSEDTNTVNSVSVTDEKTTTLPIRITVTPVAERINEDGTAVDSDGDGQPDLTMTPGHSYTATPGLEDTWFALNTGAFDLSDGWHNQDPDEVTYARLTPEMVAGDGTQTDAIGSQFRWVEGGVTKVETYAGTPIDVPVGALHTLEFLAPPNVSGKFQIRVQAHTVDYDDDSEGSGSPAIATSGNALLENLLILPDADDVTLTLGARASGLEDTPIPLSIRPTSSDPSETFKVTIGNIPVGATVTYGTGAEEVIFTATAGNTSLEIPGFDRSAPLTIWPPLHSNENFTLTVSAVSVDTVVIDGVTHTSESAPRTLPLNVIVKGVADPAEVTLVPNPDNPLDPVTYTEAALDGGALVRLSDLATVAKIDNDGSETLTIRLSGLPDGFSPSVGTLLTNPLTVTGTDRVWVLTEAQFAAATIRVPQNYSGTVTLGVTAVTTENDGNSLTGATVAIPFTVTPSPEATVTGSAELVEDVRASIGFTIVHRNGDTDEYLGNVRIKVADVETPAFTLHLGMAEDAPTLAEALADGLITEAGGWYELTAEQAGQLAARGGAHLDGDLGGFDIQYQIVDDSYGAIPAGNTTTSDWQDGHFTLTATPVTDQPALSITAIAGTDGVTVASDEQDDDDALPDTATLSGVDRVTVTLNIASPDSDGSEHLIRVLITGVPLGVTVEGAEAIGPDSWLLIYDGTRPIDEAGGIGLPVVFDVGIHAHGLTGGAPITITAQVQDRGNEPDPGTTVLSDTVQWTLVTEFEATGGGGRPPRIEEWDYIGAPATEDTSFVLSDMITAKLGPVTAAENMLTIRLEGLPEGTVVTGMIRTVIDGEEVWTASVTGGADIEALLLAKMASITITPPPDWNDNRIPDDDPFGFTATLISAVVGGPDIETETIAPDIPVLPVTDEADIAITLGSSVGPGGLTESHDEIPFTVTVNNPADGAAGSIVGGDLYLQITAPGPGTLTHNGVDIPPTPVSGVEGIPDGAYYIIPGTTMGAPVDLVFTPDDMIAGDVKIDAWVRNEETDAAPLTSDGSETLEVQISNDGVTVTTAPVTGDEAADGSRDSLIRLSGLSVGLDDNDGSERIVSILLSNLPDGFLVFTGPNEAAATEANMTSNAGGSGGVNTWVLAEGSGLPAYIGILPPKHWSGTLDDLHLIVTSGETGLPDTLTESFPLAPITVVPVANGLEIAATNTFGREGDIVSLNLNASMVDAEDASVPAAADESVETVTVEITGLGQYASFYVDGAIRTDGIAYDEDTGAYTLTGLSQSDLDGLGFRQAVDALSDQNPTTAGMQIGVTARTVDGGDVSADVVTQITVNMSRQLATSGNNSLIWTGALLDGRGGTDTVHIRYGESLTDADLAANLRNIEVLDLGIAGANAIDGLTPETLRAITDSGNALTIEGDGNDSVTLAGAWRDNGDGTYTGFITEGVTTTEVTLTVSGGVDVSAEDGFVSGFGGSSGLFGIEGFGAGFSESGGETLGLSTLGGWLEDPEEGEFDPLAAEAPPAFADLFVEDGAGDHDDLPLPGKDGAADTAPAPAPADAQALQLPQGSIWEDEFHEPALY